MSDTQDPDDGVTTNPFPSAAENPFPAAEKAKPKTPAAKPTRASKALTAVKDDDRAAPQKEAESNVDEFETTSLTFRGEKFIVPMDQDDWPILAVQAFSKGLAIDGIELLLGRLQWNRFVTKFPRKSAFSEFSDLIAEEFGFGGAGN